MQLAFRINSVWPSQASTFLSCFQKHLKQNETTPHSLGALLSVRQGNFCLCNMEPAFPGLKILPALEIFQTSWSDLPNLTELLTSLHFCGRPMSVLGPCQARKEVVTI